MFAICGGLGLHWGGHHSAFLKSSFNLRFTSLQQYTMLDMSHYFRARDGPPILSLSSIPGDGLAGLFVGLTLRLLLLLAAMLAFMRHRKSIAAKRTQLKKQI